MASTPARFQSSGCLPVGTLKKSVYAAAIDNKKAPHHHTVDDCQTIHNYPASLNG
jgi:hypothetical protein